MTPQMLLDHVIAMFPDFAARWDAPGHCHRDEDGSFRVCGVFTELVIFFGEHFKSVAPDRFAALAAFVSECFTSADARLSDAVVSCFVENIPGQPFDRALAPHLTGEVLACYRAWGGHDD